MQVREEALLTAAAVKAGITGGARLALLADALRRIGRARIRVNGASMIPAVWPGDDLAIECAGAGRPHVGDIAVFVREDRLFVHRVTYRSSRHLVTRGDALRSPDSPVPHDDVIGVVVCIERDGRLVVPGEPRWAERLLAAAVSRSTAATRLLLAGRAMIRALASPAGTNGSRDGVAECP